MVPSLLLTDDRLISKARGDVDLHSDRFTIVEGELMRKSITDNSLDAGY